MEVVRQVVLLRRWYEGGTERGGGHMEVDVVVLQMLPQSLQDRPAKLRGVASGSRSSAREQRLVLVSSMTASQKSFQESTNVGNQTGRLFAGLVVDIRQPELAQVHDHGENSWHCQKLFGT